MDHRLGFGLFFLGGGLFAIWGGIDKRFRKRALIHRAVRVKARVVSVKVESTNEDGSVDVHYPTVEFRADGKTVRAEVLVGRLRGEGVSRGKEVTAYYDPLDSTRVVLAPGDWRGGGCTTVLGVVFAAIGAGLVWNWHTGGRN